MILKDINHTEREKNRTNMSDFGKNVFINSMRFSIDAGVDDSEKSLKSRNGEEKLGVATLKVSRLSMNDGQSMGAEKEFPRGNMSHGFGIATNESRSYVVDATVAASGRGIEADEMRKQNCEPIPGVIKVLEPRGRPYQKQKAETTARLSLGMGKDEMSVEKMKTNEVGESSNTNAREDSSTLPIDSVTDATMKPEAAYINTSETDESIMLKDLTSVTVDNDLQKQQQMVSHLSEGNRNTNKSNGNLDTDKIDIRVLRSNRNETMNVKEGIQTVTEDHEYHKSSNNVQRKLLWISEPTNSADGDLSIKNTKPVFNIMTESHIENVMNENQQQNKTTDSANLKNVSSTRIKREGKAEENRILQDVLNSQISDIDHYPRYKRSVYPYENLESNNEAENMAVEKEAPINYDEKQEGNEEYLIQNVEDGDLDGIYDREDDVLEDDKAIGSKREGQSSFRQQVDPVRAKVDMLIKQKLDKKHKDNSIYRRKRHSMLNMIEYYDYNDDEEQKRDVPINEQEIQNKDNKLSISTKIKRDGKPSYKTGGLGKKKNENAEAMMKEKFRKTQAKNKEPKEEIIVNLGERKSKTSNRNNKKPLNSLGSSFENIFNEEKQLSTKENSEKIRQSKDFANVHNEELAAIKSKW
ncbi:putative uncharacterized protein DDB_G0282499 [Monomorium pharaonis]|uniref:putative uncharacterized protein DDB_G0282499 n=1 Tax=Monomorium pharaonis TaxID=307658 RepID=UPI00174693F2|nr:putative uncharacterized protein DDB_G0282499 [Monomorium pharaonis]